MDDPTNNFLLCHEPRELILSGLVELAQLHALDLGTDIGSEVNSGGAIQQVGEAGIGIFSMVVVLEGFKWRIANYTVSCDSDIKSSSSLTSCQSRWVGSLGIELRYVYRCP